MKNDLGTYVCRRPQAPPREGGPLADDTGTHNDLQLPLHMPSSWAVGTEGCHRTCRNAGNHRGPVGSHSPPAA